MPRADAEGLVTPDEIRRHLTDTTALVSLMHGNNEVGTLQPIRDLARLAREKGIILHTDAVQTFGRLPLNVRDLGVDMLSVSAHKLGGPKGVGALYIRKGTPFRPLMMGGPQERERRPGTENVPAITGFAAAVREAVTGLDQEAARVAGLRDALWNGLRTSLDGLQLNGRLVDGLPNTLNVSFAGIDGDDLTRALDMAGVAVSTGSACTVGAVSPSHVLRAMGCDAARMKSAVRFSLGWGTVRGEIDETVRITAQVVGRLRSRRTAFGRT
jgi:cysteine desulfurase